MVLFLTIWKKHFWNENEIERKPILQRFSRKSPWIRGWAAFPDTRWYRVNAKVCFISPNIQGKRRPPPAGSRSLLPLLITPEAGIYAMQIKFEPLTFS